MNKYDIPSPFLRNHVCIYSIKWFIWMQKIFNILSCITIFHTRNFCPKMGNKSYFFLNDDRFLGILMANINRWCFKKKVQIRVVLHEIYWWYIYDVLINKCITDTMRSRLDVLLFLLRAWFMTILSLFIVRSFFTYFAKWIVSCH